jgi:hypothetical protein
VGSSNQPFVFLSKGGIYIIDFTIEYNDSFSEDERKFVEGPQKRLLEEIYCGSRCSS